MEHETLTLRSQDLLGTSVSSDIFRRELQVLIGGGLQGLGRGASQSLDDAARFGADLKNDPVRTSARFVRDHWSEAAVAGAIAFVAPKKYFHMLLLAASGRGVALSTCDAFLGAADSSQPMEQVRERFANNIAGESRMLINSLPMTIAGGVLGRSAANATFGRNMGAADFAAGKVSLSDVRTNLLSARDKIFPPMAKLAVVDLDGTLVSTSRHLALGIEQGNKHLAAATGLSEELVSNLMAEQFGRLKSFTNPWTVELALAEKLNVGRPGGMTFDTFKNTVSDPYWKVFDSTVTQNLKVYDGVHQTLGALRQKNIPVVLWSNSPASAAIPRMRPHGIETQVSRAVMLENARPPAGLAPELTAHGAERLAAFMGPEKSAFSVVTRELAKPTTDFLRHLMNEKSVRPSQVVIIGDSLQSDMMLAHKSGARGLWARWAEVDAPFDARLNQVTRGGYPPAPTTGVPFESQLFSFSDALKKLQAPRDISGLLRSSLGAPHWLTPAESYGLTLTPRPGDK